MKKIIVLFKTHLDVGFTNLAGKVVEQYLTSYIPKAMETARQLRGTEDAFIWTVGSWMIAQFLERAEQPLREQMEDSIRHGEISWNGMPFTTHTELMDEELFSYGLSIAGKLDAKYGTETIAGKMTDVPGHTRAIIAPMCRAGIRFLHLGVNPAAAVPDVPELFRWRDEGGKEILVMYNKDYGDFTQIPGTDTAVYFAHTGDNLGPQSADAIRQVYRSLREKYPEAVVQAGTLNDVARLALTLTDIPVVTKEIGDSWIRGVGSDPHKVSQFRALLRCAKNWPEVEKEAMYAELLQVPEHTWGLDEKTWLGTWGKPGEQKGDYAHLRKEDFKRARQTQAYQYMEESWEEQRSFVVRAADTLRGEHRDMAGKCLAQYREEKPSLAGYNRVEAPAQCFASGDLTLCFNQNGALTELRKDGVRLASPKHPIGDCLYEVFSQKEYDRYIEQYATSREAWAMEDMQKIGEEEAIDEYFSERPVLQAVYEKEGSVIALLSFGERACEEYGAPRELMLQIDSSEEGVELDFAWWKKDASRLPEAVWLGLCPPDQNLQVRKLGQWIDVLDTVDNAGRLLHATDYGVRYDGLEIESLDAALVAPGHPSMLDYTNEKPETNAAYFNLFNNTWGTNFVMWYGEDARFRFHIKSRQKRRQSDAGNL